MEKVRLSVEEVNGDVGGPPCVPGAGGGRSAPLKRAKPRSPVQGAPLCPSPALQACLCGPVVLDGRFPEPGAADLDLEPGDPEDPCTCRAVDLEELRYPHLTQFIQDLQGMGLDSDEIEMGLRVMAEQAGRWSALGSSGL